MIRVEIIANRSVEENILDAFRDEGVGKFYTKYPSVLGVGTSGPRMGDAVWPEENFALVVWCEAEEAEGIARAVARVKKVFPQEGIKLFMPEEQRPPAPPAALELEQKDAQSLLPAPSFDASELQARLAELQARLAAVSPPPAGAALSAPPAEALERPAAETEAEAGTEAAEPEAPDPAPAPAIEIEEIKEIKEIKIKEIEIQRETTEIPEGPAGAEYQGPEAENR
jgi:hypothetical protein